MNQFLRAEECADSRNRKSPEFRECCATERRCKQFLPCEHNNVGDVGEDSERANDEARDAVEVPAHHLELDECVAEVRPARRTGVVSAACCRAVVAAVARRGNDCASREGASQEPPARVVPGAVRRVQSRLFVVQLRVVELLFFAPADERIVDDRREDGSGVVFVGEVAREEFVENGDRQVRALRVRFDEVRFVEVRRLFGVCGRGVRVFVRRFVRRREVRRRLPFVYEFGAGFWKVAAFARQVDIFCVC